MSEQTKDGGQDLHARIMNIPCKAYDGTDAYTHYCRGHRDARHAAAELAAEHGHALHLAQSRIRELETALRDVVGWIPGVNAWHTDAPIEAVKRARSVLNKENGNGH